jgi:DNA-binding MltR family transcriptional regulator
VATDKEIEAGANALKAFFVKLAREAVDRIAFDPFDVGQFVRTLLQESETAQVLIFSSYIDDRLQSLLMLQMQHLDTQNAIDAVFGLNGPLDTFNRRILIAYHLGWISEDTRRRVDAFRKLRNAFAHRAFTVTFNDPKISSYREILDYRPAGFYDNINNAQGIERRLKPTLLTDMVMMAGRLFEELLVFPVIRLFPTVHPREVMFAEEETPELIKKVRHEILTGIFLAGGWD